MSIQRLCQIIVLTVIISIGITAAAGQTVGSTGYFRSKLTGFQETPAILSKGSGEFKARLDRNESTLSYTLTFTELSSPVTVAHIHFAQAGVAGAVVAFLCGGGGKPACPAQGGTISGKIIAADILGVPAQGINAGSFQDFLTVLKNGLGYVNVHSMLRPGGEIRGQIGC